MMSLSPRRQHSRTCRALGLDSRRRPTLRARLRASWKAAELDQALADGVDPLESDELTLKAAQLVEPKRRTELARILKLVVDQVTRGGPSPVPGPPILRRAPIADNRRLLVALIRRLRDDDLHCLRGLAMADRLIRFGDSPLYMALGPLQLKHRVEDTLAAFEPDWDGIPADMPRVDGSSGP